MVAMVADIANLEAGVLAELLLNLQAVLQVGGVLDVWVNVKDAGRREARVHRADGVEDCRRRDMRSGKSDCC